MGLGLISRIYNRFDPKPVEKPTRQHSGEIADQAIASAVKDLAEAYARRPQVDALVSHAAIQLAENGFGATIEASFERKYA